MPEWNDPKIRDLVIQGIPGKEYQQLRIAEFDSLVSGQNDTWDFQFCFYHYLYHGISVTPSRNMVQNIGTNRADAVHMQGESPYDDLKVYPQPEEIKDNPVMVPDFRYDVEVVRKAHPYFFEEPVYPPHPEPTPAQKASMALGKMIGEKGPVRSLVNLLKGK